MPFVTLPWWVGGLGCMVAVSLFLKQTNSLSSFLSFLSSLRRESLEDHLGEEAKEILELVKRKKYDQLLIGWEDEDLRGVISLLCCTNKPNELRQLLQSSPEWEKKAREEVDREGHRPIHLAMKQKFVEVVEILLDAGVLVDQKNAQGWTALHMACAAGSKEGLLLLLQKGTDINLQDKGGHTPLIICCANGFSEMANILLDQENISLTPTTFSRQQNCLHFASLRGDSLVCEKILQCCARQDQEQEEQEQKTILQTVLQQRTLQGWTPLLSCLLSGSVTLLSFYLDNYAQFLDIFDDKNDGEGALHVAVKVLGREIEKVEETGGWEGMLKLWERKKVFERVLEEVGKGGEGKGGRAFGGRDCFGKTPLHLAAMGGWVWVVGRLLVEAGESRAGEMVGGRDNDGLSVLHSLCGSGAKGLRREAGVLWLEEGEEEEGEDEEGEEETALVCLMRLFVRGPTRGDKVGRYLFKNRKEKFQTIDVDCLDLCDSTSLHIAAANSNGFEAVQTLLELGADITKTSVQGWTPLHLAYNQCPKKRDSNDTNNKNDADAILELMEEHCKKFPHLAEWRRTSFDVLKEKEKGGERRSLCVSEEEKQYVFDGGDASIDSITKMIEKKKIENIVVLAGAGMSVSSGIPDYRSKTGIYRNSSALDISSSSSSSSSSVPKITPFSPQVFQEDPHYFYEVMKKLFLPVYKNETRPSKTHRFLKVLSKKGLLKRVYTQNIDMLELNAGLDEKLVVECHGSMRRAYCTNVMCEKRWNFSTKQQQGEERKEENFYWKAIEEGGVPRCGECGSVVRPDVVLFGEPLPPSFSTTQHEDFKKCDLLVVVGTTLTVHPFSSLPNRVSLLTPRLLLNMESVGPFQRIGKSDSYRDVQMLGKCDESVSHICERLGWKEELGE